MKTTEITDSLKTVIPNIRKTLGIANILSFAFVRNLRIKDSSQVPLQGI
jgi:hypothetical protein